MIRKILKCITLVIYFLYVVFAMCEFDGPPSGANDFREAPNTISFMRHLSDAKIDNDILLGAIFVSLYSALVVIFVLKPLKLHLFFCSVISLTLISACVLRYLKHPSFELSYLILIPVVKSLVIELGLALILFTDWNSPITSYRVLLAPEPEANLNHH